MNLSQPALSLFPRSLTGAVLTVLAGTTKPLTGREVHRLLRVSASHTGVQKVLRELVAHGIVAEAQSGNATLNELNREHLLAPIIEQLPSLRAAAFKSMADIIRHETPGILKALLFGSVARGDSDHMSDIDLVLVWPDGTEDDVQSTAASNIGRKVQRLTGNACTPLHFSRAEYEGLAKKAPELHTELADDSIDLLVRDDGRS
jgi:predicted nucleotidyltransferase